MGAEEENEYRRKVHNVKRLVEKSVMVKSAKCEEGDELMDRTSSKENGKAMVETKSTTSKADNFYVDIEMDRYDTAN